jgi:hypothetical protein
MSDWVIDLSLVSEHIDDQERLDILVEVWYNSSVMISNIKYLIQRPNHVFSG